MEQAAVLPSDALTALIRVRRSLCRESRGRRAKPLAHGYSLASLLGCKEWKSFACGSAALRAPRLGSVHLVINRRAADVAEVAQSNISN